MKRVLHEQTIPGLVHPIHLSEPVIFADNEKYHRSGHLGHAMTEFAPGKVMAFCSSTSGYRFSGHAHFGWMEYAISEDYGETFGEKVKLPYAWKSFLDGVHTIAVEKAITTADGHIAAFCAVGSQDSGGCMNPWACPTVVISQDHGKTWSEPIQVTGYPGRIYDVIYQNGAAYVLEFCNPCKESSRGTQPEHVYRLFKSTDNCRTFQEVSILPIDGMGRFYGNLIFTPSGDLIAYAYNSADEYSMDYCISHDKGKTWETPGVCALANRIRNPQVGFLDGQYILHGRAGENGKFCKVGAFVIYTSADGIHWDEGKILVKGRPSCFYSENLTLTLPDGSQKMLLKYSENYCDPDPEDWPAQVNSMMLTITSCKD